MEQRVPPNDKVVESNRHARTHDIIYLLVSARTLGVQVLSGA
jgi:hypothetical protein